MIFKYINQITESVKKWVRIDKTELTLGIVEMETLIATVLPEKANNKAVSWKSNDNNVATVDDNGKIIAIDGGTAFITATTKDGNKTTTCTVIMLYGNIMDTLKGEWTWFWIAGGWGGGINKENQFKSVLKILS